MYGASLGGVEDVICWMSELTDDMDRALALGRGV